MAVTTKSKGTRQFREQHRTIVGGLVVGGQTAVFAGLAAGLLLSGMVESTNLLFWVVLLVGYSVSLYSLILILTLALRPLDDILAVVAHKTGEHTLSTPPNPNSKRNEETGFKAILETLYSTEATPADTSKKHDLLTEALNHTSCGVVILGPDKKIISANTATPIAHTQSGEPYIAVDFLEDEDIMTWVAGLEEKAINAERRWKRVSTDPRVVKKQRIFDIVASYEKGAEAETIIMLIDQSEQYLPEEEDLNFIAFAAHELRGPITVIRGYLDVLQQEVGDRLKGDEPELLSRLTISANRLSGYVNNILNVARYDRHHLEVHLYEDTVHNIYASIADDMQMRAQAQHRLLSINIPEDLPTIAADRGSISEVMGNLIDNAIKYSFEGGVVTVSAVQKGDFVEVSVTDNGIGMPSNVVKNLFRKFYRSHRSREVVAGTGIGLYITRAFVESHGGNVSVQSRENEGSTFTFTLPTYASVSDKLLEDGQLNQSLMRSGASWIKNHTMYRG